MMNGRLYGWGGGRVMGPTNVCSAVTRIGREMKKVALVLVVLLICLFGWWLIQSGDISVAVNGHELAGPIRAVVGGWGFLVATVVLFCVAILLAFVFAGIGLVVLGSLVLVGLILVAIAFPFLLPLLLPLFIVWAFVAWIRRGKTSTTGTSSKQPPD